MGDNDTRTTEAPTRREYMRYGGAIAAGTALAGCSDLTGRSDENETSGNGLYSVTMEPVGTVEFESVPEAWVASGPGLADMGIALGQADGLAGIAFEYYYDSLQFVLEQFDTEGPQELSTVYNDGFDKEAFYEIGADIHLIDPNQLAAFDDTWNDEDTKEITRNVGPFFGNSSGSDRGWNSDYLLSMYDLLERFAQVFDEPARYEALVSLHDRVQQDVESRLPSRSERPAVGVLLGGSDPESSEFFLSNITPEVGFRHKHYRDLGIVDAFDPVDFGGERFVTVDYEGLLEIDPDVLLFDNHLPGFSRSTAIEGTEDWQSAYLEPMANHPVGRELTAVRAGRVYPTGMGEQGPITNLFNTELLGRQLYPESFSSSERLFDRQRVADVINGDFEQ